jgi:hypothetical protein
MEAGNQTWRQGPGKNMERYLSSHIAHPLTATSKAIKDFALSVRLSKWRLISTAPSNQELELRIMEDGKISVLEFPCLRTNTGTWINVDLGAEIKFQAVEWRVWQHDKAPQPHHSQIKLGGRHATLRHAKNLHARRLRPLWNDAIQ